MKYQIAELLLMVIAVASIVMGCSNGSHKTDLSRDSVLAITKAVASLSLNHEVLVKTISSLPVIPETFSGYPILVEKSFVVSEPRNVYLLVVNSDETIEQVISKIKTDPNVILAQKNNKFGPSEILESAPDDVGIFYSLYCDGPTQTPRLRVALQAKKSMTGSYNYLRTFYGATVPPLQKPVEFAILSIRESLGRIEVHTKARVKFEEGGALVGTLSIKFDERMGGNATWEELLITYEEGHPVSYATKANLTCKFAQ